MQISGFMCTGEAEFVARVILIALSPAKCTVELLCETTGDLCQALIVDLSVFKIMGLRGFIFVVGRCMVLGKGPVLTTRVLGNLLSYEDCQSQFLVNLLR
jgi:hypothetical protein